MTNACWPCGHPETPENTYIRDGYRGKCRECRRQRDRDRQKAKRKALQVNAVPIPLKAVAKLPSDHQPLLAIRVIDIVGIAAKLTGISVDVIKSYSRYAEIVRIRQACYLIAKETGRSLCQIGSIMSRDHSSVIHGINRAEKLAQHDPEYARFVDELRSLCRWSKPFSVEKLTHHLFLPETRPEPPQPVVRHMRMPMGEDELIERNDGTYAAHMRAGSARLRDAVLTALAA